MKKNILLFCTFLFSIPILVGFSEGEYVKLVGTGTQNRTGSPTHSGYPAVVGCSSGTGCHASATTPFALNFSLTDVTAGNILSTGTYIPGDKYLVKITGAYPTEPDTSLPSFGFQCAVVGWQMGSDRFHGAPPAVKRIPSGGGPPDYAWNPFTPDVPTGVDTFLVDNAYMIENTFALTNHGSSSAHSSWEANFYWEAPESVEADTIGFWYVLCAADSDGTSAHDITFIGPRDGVVYVNGDSVSKVNDIFYNAQFSCYPNPLKDQLHISMNNLQVGSYTFSVFDMSGRQLLTQDLNINSASFNTQLNTSSWPKGIYQLKFTKDGSQHTISVLKQ